MSRKRSVSYLVFSILLIAMLVIGLIGCDDPNQAPEEVKKTISFESNGGSAVTAITGIIGSEVGEPVAPTKEGYVFKGWYLDNDTFQNKYTFTTIPLEDIKVYAKWEAQPTEGGDGDSGNKGDGTEGETGGEPEGEIGGETETHVFGEWKVVNIPTELMEGKAVRTCTNKGCNEKEEKVLPILSMENYDHKIPENAKCGEDVDITVILKSDTSVKFTIKEFFNHMPTAQYDAEGHWYICPYCHEAISDKAPHRFEKKTDDQGHVSYVCKDCGYVQGGEEVAVKPYADYKYIMDVVPTSYYNGVKHTNLANSSNGDKMVFTLIVPTEKATSTSLIDTSLITKENYKSMLATLLNKSERLKSGKYTVRESYMGPESVDTYVFSNGIVNVVEKDPEGYSDQYTLINTYGGLYELRGNTYSYKPNSKLLTVVAPDEGIEMEMNPLARVLLNPAMEFETSSKFGFKDTEEGLKYTVEITPDGFAIRVRDYMHGDREVTSIVFENVNGYNNTTLPRNGAIINEVPAIYDLFCHIVHYGTNYETTRLIEVSTSTLGELNQLPTQLEVNDEQGHRYIKVTWYIDKARTIEFDVNAYKNDLRDLDIYGKYGNVIPKKVVNVHLGERVEQVEGYTLNEIHQEVAHFEDGPKGGEFYKDSTFKTPINWKTDTTIPTDIYLLVIQNREFSLVVGGVELFEIVKNRTGDPTIDLPLYGKNSEDGKYYTLPTTWYTDNKYTVEFNYDDYKLAQGTRFVLYGKAFGDKVPEYNITFISDQKPDLNSQETYCVARKEDPFKKTLIGRNRVEGLYTDEEKTQRFDEEKYKKNPTDITLFINLKTEVTKYEISIMAEGKEVAKIPYFDDEFSFSLPRMINGRTVKQLFSDPEMTKPFDENFYIDYPSNLTLYTRFLDDPDKYFNFDINIYDLAFDNFSERITWDNDIDLVIPYYDDYTCEVYEYYLDRGKTTKFVEEDFKNAARDITIYRVRTGKKTPNAKKITINQNKGQNTIEKYHDTTIMGDLTMEKLTLGSKDSVTFYTDPDMTQKFDLVEWNNNPVEITIYCNEIFH